MHRRYEHLNVPIEQLRALIAIVDHNGFTRASEALGLTQSTISAQAKRLARLVGGDLFVKGRGLELTKRGAQVLKYAREIVAINDEMLANTGPNPKARNIMLGLPQWWGYSRLLEVFSRVGETTPSGERILFRNDTSSVLTRELVAGNIDIAYLCNVEGLPGQKVIEWREQMYWLKSPALTLNDKAPVPLICWTGTLPDRIATALLRDAGIPYEIKCSSADPSSRAAAVAAGIGICMNVERIITPDIQIATEDFLPAAPPVTTGLYARSGLRLKRLTAFLDMLIPILEPRPPAQAKVIKLTRAKLGRKGQEGAA
jgi:DNA-binding transcriptional LysR family regulator